MKRQVVANQKFLNIAAFVIVALFLFVIAYLLGISLAFPTLLLIVFIFLKAYYQSKIMHLAIRLGLLLAIIVATSYSLINYPNFYYLVPVCAISMLVVILFGDLKLAFVMALLCAVAVGEILNNNFSISIIFLIGGLVSSLCAWQSRHRAQIIKAGLISGIIQAFSFILFLPTNQWLLPGFLKLNTLFLLINGIVSSFFVVGCLPLFEYLFGVLTNISLLELSDFNHPLLKRMILEAPGTYQHSLMVGNLSEVACEAIGANSLLARVGAYYHDIGKLEKAEYFSENQALNSSKHDKILPTISKLIIVGHVKDGVALAKKYKLNPLIIDCILQHHGTSLTYYFYCRALEDMKCEEEIKEEGFRYPGPKPQTKEIAITHLADSIEAASRTLDEPTPARIEEIVRKIINNKFIDGQLDECELTLKDLERIAATFIRVISAMYHSRIKYP
ncbi:MAG: HDIG domain-containing protein [Candidatus Omnitrophota bacterium]|nr:HDIG domain-containing protein [Candidatus Omnitrophota bacterium]